MGQDGTWFDGQVALGRPVHVVRESAGLVLTAEDGGQSRAAVADLVRLDAAAGQVRLGHRSLDGWRLLLEPPVDPAMIAGVPRRGGAHGPAVGRPAIIALAGLFSIVTVAAAAVIFAPETVAAQLPMSWERRIGSVYDLPVEMTRCDDAQAQAALNRILDRIDPDARSDGFTIELIDFDDANAAALPGGRMIVLNGLFEQVDSTDAVAGIVAHEVAHVRRRHVAAGMVRELGLGTIVTLLGGGAIASNAGGLLSLRYSRSAEAEADADAARMLKQAGIDPRPTAAAFAEFDKRQGDWPEWLDSHPASGGRAARFAASHEAGRTYRPVLAPGWSRRLLTACSD